MNLQDSLENHYPTTTRGFRETVNWNLKGALFPMLWTAIIRKDGEQ
jgi:hypothetical protein